MKFSPFPVFRLKFVVFVRLKKIDVTMTTVNNLMKESLLKSRLKILGMAPQKTVSKHLKLKK